MENSKNENVLGVKSSSGLRKSRFDETFENGQTVLNGKICIRTSRNFPLRLPEIRRFYDDAFAMHGGTAIIGVFEQAGNIPTYKTNLCSALEADVKLAIWLNPLPTLPCALNVVTHRYKSEPVAAALSGNFFMRNSQSVHLTTFEDYFIYYLSRYMWIPVLRKLGYCDGRATKAAADRYALMELERWRSS